MNRSVYRKVAKEHGVSVKEVKRDMQLAIDAAYENPNPLASAVPRKGDVPTTEEFISYIVKQIKEDMKKEEDKTQLILTN